MTCTTHHHACDCREEAHRKEIELLKARVRMQAKELRYLQKFLKVSGYYNETTQAIVDATNEQALEWAERNPE